MKRLLILRHAKAEAGLGADDFHRALTDGGREDARHVGDWVAANGWIPDAVVHSSARRTTQTAEVAAARWPKSPPLRGEPGLYNASAPALLAVTRDQPAETETLMIVGHNPSIGEIANALAGSGDEFDRLRMAGKYPTSALAVLEFDLGSWAQIGPRGGRLAAYVTPTDLGLRG